MKLKISLGSDDLKGLFFAHVEKLVLALIILLSAGLVMLGYRKEKTSMTPDVMRERAKLATQHIQVQWIKFQQRPARPYNRRMAMLPQQLSLLDLGTSALVFLALKAM